MDGLPDKVDLLLDSSGTIVAAIIVRLTRELAQRQIDGQWWKLPGVSKVVRKEENDYHWRWAKEIGELRKKRWHEAFAVQTEDGCVQGAIIYRLDCKSFIDDQFGTVNVRALATAPRNRPWLVEAPLYRGVGESLLLRAVGHSYLLGLNGRVSLVAFGDKRTLDFYRHRGFTDAGDEDGLPRLELLPEAAQTWLREEGYEL